MKIIMVDVGIDSTLILFVGEGLAPPVTNGFKFTKIAKLLSVMLRGLAIGLFIDLTKIVIIRKTDTVCNL